MLIKDRGEKRKRENGGCQRGWSGAGGEGGVDRANEALKGFNKVKKTCIYNAKEENRDTNAPYNLKPNKCQLNLLSMVSMETP